MEMEHLRTIRRLAQGTGASCAILFAIGCGSSATTQPSDYDRQQQALRDPFHYNPDPNKTDYTVSGSSEFDKNAFKRDLDHVLNP